eukprot:TRINITY_DN9405_c0_g1_i1.p1 TRINITY_DN9405_c0_g1~~TRINITY_DN9405_c0_g1_i1.p1  ORF type:complete len:288 (+),score=114.80 TRINITY_DN9405_c0_g1_i1:61-864(+)
MATKAEIDRQAEEIERALEESSDEFDSEDDGILDRRIQANKKSQESFTILYIAVSVVTTLCPTYLFMTVLGMDPLEPINAGIYLAVVAATCFFLTEAYQQMYSTESRKVDGNENGKLVADLERRLVDKRYSLGERDHTSFPAPPGKRARAPQEIHSAEKPGGDWRALSEEEQKEYRTRSVAEEVHILSNGLSEMRHLQTQYAMSWSLFVSNAAFVAASLFVSFGLLRSYDARINYGASTILVGILVQLVAKHNDEAAKSRGDKKARK